MLCTNQTDGTDGHDGPGLMADSAGLGWDVRLAHWVDHKWLSQAGETAWVSVGGVRQGAASLQMPNPAEPRGSR